MPEITRDDVAHLAGLARIQLVDEELDRLGPELPKILESVATVSQALEGARGRRADEPPDADHATCSARTTSGPRLAPEDALAGAPASEGQRFLVPKILGEE